jgi:HlyD family secretion protein
MKLLNTKYIIGIAVLAVAVLLLSGYILTTKENSESGGPTYTVKQGPLTISFVESGTIKARDQIILKNEVEGKTSITFVVPEGTRVKKGELLIELDVSTLEDQKIDQEISVQNAEAEYISKTENLAVVENQAKSDVDLAILTLDFAKQDLEKYQKGEYQSELLKANTEITLAEEELIKAEDYLNWSEKLYQEKYIPETEYKGDVLAKKKCELNVKIAQNSRELLEQYTYKRTLAQKVSDVNQAEMTLERTKRKAYADVIQAEAELKAKKSEFGRQKDKLDKVITQISKTKIYAPDDGLVIYASSAKNTGGWRGSNSEPLDVGREVYEREELIYLPTGNASDAEIMVHESYLKKISIGMPTVITVDVQDKKYYGTIQQIAPLPDARSMWMNPDLKLYTTKVAIDSRDLALRSGMSCQAEIIVEQHKEAVYVPLQAVIRVGQMPTVYVKNGKTFESRTIKVGLDNNKVIHVLEGLQDGDVVQLNPPLKAAAVNTKTDKDFGDGMQEKVSNGLKNVETTANTNTDVNTSTSPATTSEENAEAKKAERMRKKLQNMTPEQIEEMKKKFEKMTPEEQEKEKEKMKKMFEGSN